MSILTDTDSICHFPAGDRCRACVSGVQHYHQTGKTKTRWVGGRQVYPTVPPKESSERG